jgi:hypothetical protein
VSGAQLTDRARRQAIRFGAEVLTTREVTGLEVRGSARRVTFADGGSLDTHTVLLATGVSYRRLHAPGLNELTGAGLLRVRANRRDSLRRPGCPHRRRGSGGAPGRAYGREWAHAGTSA